MIEATHTAFAPEANERTFLEDAGEEVDAVELSDGNAGEIGAVVANATVKLIHALGAGMSISDEGSMYGVQFER